MHQSCKLFDPRLGVSLMWCLSLNARGRYVREVPRADERPKETMLSISTQIFKKCSDSTHWHIECKWWKGEVHRSSVYQSNQSVGFCVWLISSHPLLFLCVCVVFTHSVIFFLLTSPWSTVTLLPAEPGSQLGDSGKFSGRRGSWGDVGKERLFLPPQSTT